MASIQDLQKLIKDKKIDITQYVLVVPLKLYEKLIEQAEVEQVEGLVFLYCDGIRIMWANISNPILVTKELYNKEYNRCSFIKLI